MCGIIGYIGNRDSKDIIVKGLKRLEYRGYDSAGIAMNINGEIVTKKAMGRLIELEKKLTPSFSSNLGIGHTRWATHGKPSVENSHPHMSMNKKFCVVHNGIIENWTELKKELLEEGYVFQSETDTEIISNLFQKYDNGNFLDTMNKVLRVLEGAYAIAVISADDEDEIAVAKKASPLIIGIGKGENFIASDIPAVLEYTKDIIVLDEEEVGLIKKDKVNIYNKEGREIKKTIVKIDWNLEAAEKQGYPHFMIKEIFEQPEAIRKTLVGRVKDKKLNLPLKFNDEYLRAIDRIVVVACGTASYAGLVGANIIEELLRIPTTVELASEFRYKKPILNEKTLVVVISQSGETADTLAGLKQAKKCGARTLAITNVVGSSVAREADDVIFTQAGPEIAVASTKAYITQLIALYLLTFKIGEIRGNIEKNFIEKYLAEVIELPERIEDILKDSDEVKILAKKLRKAKHAFFLGRGLDWLTSLEGALKLKEISYIHAEAYASGELKHGTIALIEEGIPVISVITQSKLLEKSISNIIEVKTRGAKTIGIAFEGNHQLKEILDYVFYIPRVDEIFAPVLSVVPLQLLAYYVSILRGNDVDKPRNLAKSVTVE